MKFVDEGEQALKDSEAKWKEQHFQKFIPIEEVADPSTVDMENRMAERMDSGLPEGLTDEDWEDLFAGALESADDAVSEAPSPLPPEIRAIIRENSVSSEVWRGMTKSQRSELKWKIQEKIREHYVSNPTKMVHRKDKKT